MVDHLLRLFPRLRPEAFQVTSPPDAAYNCIAWAAGTTDKWWWPLGTPHAPYWPAGVPRLETVPAFQDAFATLGYFPCDSEAAEAGFDKVALFADSKGVPTHAARQLPNTRWTSKLGFAEDIEHDLRDLEGDVYGVVALVMKRPGGQHQGAGNGPDDSRATPAG